MQYILYILHAKMKNSNYYAWRKVNLYYIEETFCSRFFCRLSCMLLCFIGRCSCYFCCFRLQWLIRRCSLCAWILSIACDIDLRVIESIVISIIIYILTLPFACTIYSRVIKSIKFLRHSDSYKMIIAISCKCTKKRKRNMLRILRITGKYHFTGFQKRTKITIIAARFFITSLRIPVRSLG